MGFWHGAYIPYGPNTSSLESLRQKAPKAGAPPLPKFVDVSGLANLVREGPALGALCLRLSGDEVLGP